MSVTVREATREELPSLSALWERLGSYQAALGQPFLSPAGGAQTWVESFRRTLGRFSFAWMAEDQEGGVRAFLLARLKQSPGFLGGALVGEITYLFVDESLRGQGLGARLVRLAVERMQERGAKSVEVQVFTENAAGLQFWQNQEFTPELIQLRLVLDEAKVYRQ